MVRILIVYQEMEIGGSTSNLLSLLNEIDYSRIQVDLLLRRNEGKLFDSIPHEVGVLSPILTSGSRVSSKLTILTNPKLLFEKIVSIKVRKILGYWAGVKYLENQDLEYKRVIEDEYDVAIGYLEGWTHTFVLNHVKAKKKIGYLHLDYLSCGLIPQFDYDTFSRLDNVIFVSEKNKETFVHCFPDFVDKSYIMPHIFSQTYIRNISKKEQGIQSLQSDCLNCITVCRIVFEHKGLDRVLKVLREHANESIFDRFRWYVVGNGPDYGKMRNIIYEYGLDQKVFMLGTVDNAYAYELGMDVFLQPSHYEGKPAAVYEAMILGVPPLVTEYASAHEQIEDGKEGLIVENSEDGIYKGLVYLLEHPEVIQGYKDYMKTKNYNNTEDVEKFYRLIGV